MTNLLTTASVTEYAERTFEEKVVSVRFAKEDGMDVAFANFGDAWEAMIWVETCDGDTFLYGER